MDAAEDAIGRERETRDGLDPARAAALHATLDLPGPPPGPGDPLPPFWHWVYFWDIVPAGGLGRDGHPKTGGFIPDTGLPRRMWAGGQLTWHAPLTLGRPAIRRTRIENVARKTGRSGPLAFVTLRHEITGAEGLAVSEVQELVYRADPAPGQPAPPPRPAPEDDEVAQELHADQTVLFRYSALTFNGHRIHYDLDYCRAVEGYPGLVVHGPLLAQHLILLARDRLGGLSRFSFRALSPVFHHQRFFACARSAPEGLQLWIRGDDGRLAMQAEAAN